MLHVVSHTSVSAVSLAPLNCPLIVRKELAAVRGEAQAAPSRFPRLPALIHWLGLSGRR